MTYYKKTGEAWYELGVLKQFFSKAKPKNARNPFRLFESGN